MSANYKHEGTGITTLVLVLLIGGYFVWLAWS